MESFQEHMQEYKKQLDRGHIQDAYRGLMKYIMDLRVYFKNKYPEYFVSGIYYGYLDMTYFSFTPESIKNRKLKIAIVFVHETFRFEVWLAGSNKKVQSKYWELIKEGTWDEYHIPSTTLDVDSIMEYVLADNPNFADLDSLTQQIETGTLKFIDDVEDFLSKT
ncbi:MAG TPA: hypothetical protein HA271_01255 [Methanobacterium subterraneum]|uniref:DUF7000 domain-containing protein n=1 Tax=Methanobacterium subterraneum TaxID=59277 RepID=A0A7J4TGD6_9EURY|nr:hypothetical protein [Methanobacterium subterraneum]